MSGLIGLAARTAGGPWLYVGIFLAGLVVGTAATAKLESLYYDNEILTLKATHAETLQKIASEGAKAAAAAKQREQDMQTKITALDTAHQHELQELARATEADLARVRAGAASVRVRGACPANRRSMPRRPAAASGADAAPTDGVLPPEVAGRLLALARDADTLRAQVTGLQAYAIAVSKP